MAYKKPYVASFRVNPVLIATLSDMMNKFQKQPIDDPEQTLNQIQIEMNKEVSSFMLNYSDVIKVYFKEE